MAEFPHRLLVITSPLSQVKSRHPYPDVHPNQITQSLIAILPGLRVPFLCTETHELGEELVASYLFTKYTLAELLHIRRRAVQKWIDDGLLKARVEGTARLPRLIIETADFVRFCHEHPEAVHEGKVRPDRLEFVFKFVFPRSHVDLLPVREAKKERAAYQEQMLTEGGANLEQEEEFSGWEDEGYPLGDVA